MGQSENGCPWNRKKALNMSYVITNGTYYIFYNANGKHRKTMDITSAIHYDTADEAVSYMYKAPKKTSGYYVYDTESNKIVWRRRRNNKSKRKVYSKTTRRMIYLKANGKCELCGRNLLIDSFTIDHIQPLSKGGLDDISNLACVCEACNTMKGSCLPDDFLIRIKDILICQIDKKCKNRLLKRITYNLLNKMVIQ